MAIIRYNDGTQETSISYEDRQRGYDIWAVLNGERPAENKAQQAFIDRIANIYLNRRNKDCPASYLKARAPVHAMMDAAKPQRPVVGWQQRKDIA